MKILWLIPYEFEAVGGGAWNQVKSMYDEVEHHDIQVDFLRPGLKIKDYDLVHIFRADISLFQITEYLNLLFRSNSVWEKNKISFLHTVIHC